MHKRLLLILILAVLAGLVAGIIWWGNSLPSEPAVTEVEMTKRYVELHGAASLRQTNETTLKPIDLSKSLRLAVGGLGLAEENSNRQLGDLVTAQLNGAAGFELVERQSLAAILHELDLNWSGFVRAKDAMRAGKLLKVDWFLLGTETKINGTNSILARVVDARTGAIREAGFFAGDQPLPVVAAHLAAFLQDCRQHAAHPQPKVFLALGAFEDLSPNDRRADFPQQLRSYLTAAYQNHKVTLLEREYVEALLQEMHLDLAGMTEESWSNPPAAMQSAYWLVDGQYQSYETTNLQIELNLTIQRAFGKSFRHQLRGSPGDSICQQTKSAIDEALRQSTNFGYPSRRSEARMQMEIGKELSRLGKNSFFVYSSYGSQDTQTKRRLNDAIRAFQTVLLLEATNREAKMALAACLQTPAIDRRDEARNIYRDVLENAPPDKWTHEAQSSLDTTFAYVWSPLTERAQWFTTAMQSCTNERIRELYRQKASVAARNVAIRSHKENSLELAQARLLDDIRSKKRSMDDQTGRFYSDDYGFYSFFITFTNPAAGAQAMADLLPTLEKQFPELAPHLAAQVLHFQVDTNCSTLLEFEKTLDWCLTHPKEMFYADHYWRENSSLACIWLINARKYALAVKMMEGCRAAANQKVIDEFDKEKQLILGYAYMGAERWQEALISFESFSNKVVEMTYEGPWGKSFQPLLIETNAAFCRMKLGLKTVEDPRKFDLGKSVLCLHTPATFTADQDCLWVSIGGRLLRLNFELKTNLNLQLPVDESATVTAICPIADKIWMGTRGAGLLEFNQSSRQFQLFTVADGLMMNDIACLESAGDSLWLGYGGTTGGGLGRINLQSKKIDSFMPSLNPTTASARETAPRVAIEKIVANANANLWIHAGKDLRQFQVKPNTWKLLPAQTDSKLFCFAANSEYLIEGVSIILREIEIRDKLDRKNPTKDLHPTRLVVTADEYDHLKNNLLTNGGNRRIYSTSVGAHPPKNGLAICKFRDNSWTILEDAAGLPTPPSTLTLDGDNLWAGGKGYIALVNLKEMKVKKFCHIKATRVDRIQIAGGYMWAQFDCHLYRMPLSTLQ